MAFKNNHYAIALLVGFGLAGCGADEKTQPTPPAPPEVGISVAQAQDFRETDRYPGQVRAVTDISITPEISGKLTAVKVTDGLKVTQGEVMFEIDPLPFEAEVTRQRQLLEQARAALSIAETRQAMAERLSSSEVLSRLEVEEIKVVYETARAAEATAAAGVLSAELNLSRARIAAPTEGTVQEVKVAVGEFVSPLGGAMTTLVADGLMEVYTEVPVDEVLERRKALIENPDLIGDQITLELDDGSEYQHKGKLAFASDRVSPVTNSVTYTVMFSNPDGLLVDGQSVTVVSRASVPEDALLVPQRSVQQDQLGRYIFVLGEGNKAEKAYLELGARVGTDWLVLDGLNAGDKYVTSGILRVRAGQPVNPVEE